VFSPVTRVAHVAINSIPSRAQPSSNTLATTTNSSQTSAAQSAIQSITAQLARIQISRPETEEKKAAIFTPLKQKYYFKNITTNTA